MRETGFVDPEDAEEIGMKIIEMADRCKSMDAVVSGATAQWHFEVDEAQYIVSVTLAESRSERT